MDIVLLAKFVPDIDRLPPDAWDLERGTLIRSRLAMAFNPLDRVALRMALSVRHARPATRIVALTMGPPSAALMLREAIAYGADQAVLLTDRRFAGADTLATAYTLARAIRRMTATDIVGKDFAVCCGMQSPDGDTAQVPAQVACFLGAPLYPYVQELRAGADALELRCLSSVGHWRVRVGRRPFVATATRLHPDLPFHVDLPAMRRANAAEIVVWSPEDIALDERRIGLEGSRTRVVRVFEPAKRHGGADPISAADEEVERKAAGLMRRLRGAFAAGDPSVGTSARADPPRANGPSYYRGDCAALCELSADPAPAGVSPLAAVSLEITSACARLARSLGCRAVAIVPGRAHAAAIESLRAHGAEAVWFIEGLDGEAVAVRRRAGAIAALLRQLRPQVVVAPATLTGRVVAPYVSAQLDCGLTADCSALDIGDYTRGTTTYRGILFQTRPALGGNIMATIVSVYDDPSGGRPQMATVRPGALTDRPRPAAHCAAHTFAAPPPETFGDCVTVEGRAAEQDAIDLEDYEIVVCCGMGVGDMQTIRDVVEPFCSALEGFFGVSVGLGCSRAMVDAGILPHARQIGQTGLVIKPRIYIGLGISGAIQHKIGMENARVIVSINRDPAAPINAFADHAIVGELRQVLPQLSKSCQD
jgi:electron transfer flavoprotein alpha subunit/electron transfer flavoprotein alpha/beta subunit